MKRFLLLALFLSLAKPARAWWDEGHMVVAQIAYHHLTPQAKARADALVPIGADARNDTFVSAACWADDLKDDGVRFYDDWHYQSLPIFDGLQVRSAPREGRLLWAINQCVAILKPRFDKTGKSLPPAPEAEQARALRFLIHLVGDVHQPLHAATRYSPETPKGDRGGNDFKIVEPARTQARNLHALWDSAGGLFMGHIYDRKEGTATRETSSAFEKRYAPSKSIWENRDFAAWHRESFDLAINVVYKTPFGKQPSEKYLAQVQAVSARRITLAGYRLADLLNRIFAE